MSVLGNIALWTNRENLDLVEKVSAADVDMLRHQKADRVIIERYADRNHHDIVTSMQKHAEREKEREKIHIR